MTAKTTPGRSRLARLRPSAIAAYVFLAIVAFVMVFPFYWLMTSGVKSAFDVSRYPPVLVPTDPVWSNYTEVLFGGTYGAMEFNVPLLRMFGNSIYIAIITVVIVVVISSMAGYAFARIRFPGRTVLFVLLISALLMPITALVVPLYIIYRDLGWLGTHLPLIIQPATGGAAIVGTFLMRQFFLGLPVELEDAGRIDGLGRLGVFRHIAMPLAKPAIASVVIITFLASWDMFLEPLVFVGSPAEMLTVPVGLVMYVLHGDQPIWELQMAATSLSVIPVLLVFLVMQRQFVQGISRVGIHG